MSGDTVDHFLREWLNGKSNVGTNERYTPVVDAFLNQLGSKSKGLLSKISHKDAQKFIKSRQALTRISRHHSQPESQAEKVD